MLANCMRKEVGIVGAKLFYNDDTVQHGGVILGFGGVAGHACVGIDKRDPGYFARAFLSCDYSAVTAACMMISKELYNEVGGFSEEYAVAFNDVDFCMKVREKDTLLYMMHFHSGITMNQSQEDWMIQQKKWKDSRAKLTDFRRSGKNSLMQETHIIIRISHLRKLYLCWIKNSWLYV